ncbi:glycosyltransferase [Alcanivorax marinus]|uniref:Glycosyltransferase n=1 Tax=Alloalcanivorax marinus TaxID=1177169 RepID=A0A9Q3YP82_9GAMM|nr:glycosyltransferase [Alloalcanivorax marinus]MCC4309526.1 glycosyltransferase [Alloalcanivorax marinus]
MFSKKVSVVIYDFEPRGVQRSQVRLASQLREDGFDVEVVSFNAKGPLLEQLSSGIAVHDLQAGSVKGGIVALTKYLYSRPNYLVLSAEDHVNCMILMVRFFFRMKFRLSVSCRVSPMLWANRPTLFSKNWILKKLVHLFYPLAEQRVMLSDGMADEYARLFGLRRESLKIIYNPVLNAPSAVALPEISHDWFSVSGAPVVLGVGHLSEIKGFDVLIRAFSIVRKKTGARLIIVGQGPERETLKLLSRQLGVEEHVYFAGFQENPMSFMKHADLFVLSSRSEGLPGVLIEAIGSDCPVVSTRCGGGALEIMEHGRVGPLVEVDDVEGLASAILEQLASPPDLKKLRVSAQRFHANVVSHLYVKDLNI